VKWNNVIFTLILILVFTNCETNVDTRKTSNELLQKHLVLKANSAEVLDLSINNSIPNENRSQLDHIGASAWTSLGNRFTLRSLIGFNTEVIKDVAMVDSVNLLLHLMGSSKIDPTLNGNSGENALYFQRIDSDWDVANVSWINQPNVSYKNQAKLNAVGLRSEGSIEIDVTQMYKDYRKSNSSNFGVYIRLQKEEIYSRVLFASSNHSDSTKHPSLEIYYKE
jgi:hypothetical protein